MVSELRNGSSMRMKNELANQYMRTFSHFGELSALLPEPKRISNEMREASQVNKLGIGKVSARLDLGQMQKTWDWLAAPPYVSLMMSPSRANVTATTQPPEAPCNTHRFDATAGVEIALFVLCLIQRLVANSDTDVGIRCTGFMAMPATGNPCHRPSCRCATSCS